MLSAVAARKQRNTTVQNGTAEVVQTISNVDSKPVAKRKFNQANSETMSRKHKKQHTISEMIVDTMESTPEPYSTLVIESKDRGYSPSAPVVVTDNVQSNKMIEELSTPSTFHPILGHNLFIEKTEDDKLTDRGNTPAYLALNPGETLSFRGSVSLRVLCGTVSIYGCSLSASPKSHSIFAPKGYPIATIVVHEAGNTKEQMHEIPASLPSRLHEQMCIVELSDLPSSSGDILSLFGASEPIVDWSRDVSTHWGLRDFHLIQKNFAPDIPFQILPSWNEGLDHLSYEKAPCIMVKGPKNTGKSMFTRMVVNQLLQKYRRVAYLDCDIGQPEFTPPGMVSLHVLTEPIFGPPFTHLRNPFRAHFVGSTSIRSLPLHYQACVLQLLETYRLDIQYAFDLDEEIHDNAETEEVPLVINMFGWTKGVGAEITRDIEASANLTHVFTFDPDGTSQTNENPKLEEIHYTILEPIKLPQSDPTPADKRALMLMSYFHHKPADSATDADGVSNEGRPIQWQMDLPLCAMPPWEVKWAETFDRIVLIGDGSEDVHRTEVLRALNGAIVALIELELSSTEWSSTREQHDSSSASGSIPYVQGTGPPPPSSSHCIGYALIRSVRASTGILHLLTPVPPNSLERARAIAMGEIRLPIQGMLDHRPRAKTLGQIAGVDYANTPFLHWNTGLPGTPGSKNLRVRRNLMRKSQIER